MNEKGQTAERRKLVMMGAVLAIPLVLVVYGVACVSWQQATPRASLLLDKSMADLFKGCASFHDLACGPVP